MKAKAKATNLARARKQAALYHAREQRLARLAAQ